MSDYDYKFWWAFIERTYVSPVRYMPLDEIRAYLREQHDALGERGEYEYSVAGRKQIPQAYEASVRAELDRKEAVRRLGIKYEDLRIRDDI